MLDRAHSLFEEQLREESHHHLAVHQHVRHAGRNAKVVFEHVILAVVISDNVHAGDRHVGVVRHFHADHLGLKLRVAFDLLARN